MKTIRDFIQEKYNPLLNRNHNTIVGSIFEIIDNSKMKKDEVIDMLNDILTTIEKEY